MMHNVWGLLMLGVVMMMPIGGYDLFAQSTLDVSNEFIKNL